MVALLYESKIRNRWILEMALGLLPLSINIGDWYRAYALIWYFADR